MEKSEQSNNQGISIIIPAWKVKDYASECLNSLYSQSWINENKNWEILVGIDACLETLNTVKKCRGQNTSIFWFHSPVGPYLIRNTLAYKAQYSKLLFFDADDVAGENLIPELIKNFSFPLIVFRCEKFPGRPKQKKTVGQFAIDRNVFYDFGGFRPWRVQADSEFLHRVENNGYERKQLRGYIHIFKRMHAWQLTKMARTGMSSPMRKQLQRLQKNLLREKTKRIEPEFAECREIGRNKPS